MAQQKTSTNSSSMLDPTVVVHSSESTKTSDLTGIIPIQPKKLFHLNITREATTSPNGQPHVRVGAVLPKRYALSDKYTLAKVIFDFLGAYISLKISHVVR
ncbi:hypothetical protein HN51_040831, partial [Arachis hypogaea]